MKEIVGDLKEIISQNPLEYDIVCCTTNKMLNSQASLVMGAGTAKVFKERFPHIDAIWGRQLITYPNRKLLITGFRLEGQYTSNYAVGFATKNDWRKPSDMKLIEQSANALSMWLWVLGEVKVLLPKPGCDLGGLKWEDVKPLLEKYLDDRVTIIDRA